MSQVVPRVSNVAIRHNLSNFKTITYNNFLFPALAYTLHLGPKLKSNENPKPHSMVNLIIGTTLIWFGSFGYNAGSGNGITSD